MKKMETEEKKKSWSYTEIFAMIIGAFGIILLASFFLSPSSVNVSHHGIYEWSLERECLIHVGVWSQGLYGARAVGFVVDPENPKCECIFFSDSVPKEYFNMTDRKGRFEGCDEIRYL